MALPRRRRRPPWQRSAPRSSAPARARARASSHREAPLISEDPSADNTDLYAFRSPDKPNTVTIVVELDPGRGSRRPARTTSRSRRTRSTRSRSTGPATPRRTSSYSSVSAARPAPPSSATPSRAGRVSAATRSCSPAGRRRRTTSARARRRTTATWRQGGRAEGRRLDLRRPARRRVLRRHRRDLRPGRASARARATRAAARTSSPATASTRSRCRSRSRSSTTPNNTIGVWSSTERPNVTVARQAPARLDAGVADRQPARQRGRRPDALQGRVEPLGAR